MAPRIPSPGITKEQVERFTSIITDLRQSDRSVSIIIAQIDPDAIGAAFGMQELLRVHNLSSTIYYAGAISAHPQNEAICNKFNLLERMTPIKIDTLLDPDRVILVDSNKADDGRVGIKINPTIVVDHHRGSDIEDRSSKFIWIDDEAGSASTMILELLSATLPEDWELRADLALILALGIYTDCKYMINAGVRDDEAFAWAKRIVSKSDLKSLAFYKKPESYFKNFSTALSNYRHKHGRLVSTVGHIPAKQGDDLAMIADEFLRKNGVTLAVVWGVIEGPQGNSVRVCARSEDLTLNLNEFLRERFGERSGAKTLPDGAGEGGALVQLEIGPWLRESEMVDIISRRINEWLFDEIEQSETNRG